jgi:aryl-alcohol dehydrogenase-like predicted oxidoreductase
VDNRHDRLVYRSKNLPINVLKLFASTPWETEIPSVGFGCCPMGGHAWGRVNDDELCEAVATALDLGVRLFDTSDIYGFGASEHLLGRALRGKRQRAVIATKFGVRHQNGRTYNDTSSAWITEAAEGSLRRLGTDCIDLYQMHYWDGVTPFNQIVETLEALRSAGKIRAYGVTNIDPRTQGLGAPAGQLASFSYHYSLVHREYEDLISSVQQQPGMFFMSWGSLGQGVLSGEYHTLEQLAPTDRRRREVYDNFHGEKFLAIQTALKELRATAADAGIPRVSQLALRWVVDKFPRALPLVGIKRPAQIIDAVGMLQFELDPAVCARIDRATVQFKTPIPSP